MRGSEYIAARMAITFLATAASIGVVAATAMVFAPWVASCLSRVMPDALGGIGGLAVGLAVVVATAVLMRRFMGYVLVSFERWVVDHGGIEDED